MRTRSPQDIYKSRERALIDMFLEFEIVHLYKKNEAIFSICEFIRVAEPFHITQKPCSFQNPYPVTADNNFI